MPTCWAVLHVIRSVANTAARSIRRRSARRVFSKTGGRREVLLRGETEYFTKPSGDFQNRSYRTSKNERHCNVAVPQGGGIDVGRALQPWLREKLLLLS
jgi:hypothetical protein